MTTRFNMPRVQAFDANGNPGSGWKLYFYEPTTLTPKDVYSDSSLSTVITQPVTADSSGRWATIFMDPSLYRVILKDASSVTKWDEDNYDPALGAGFGVSSTVGISQGGTGATNAAAARANLGAASSSALTTVQNTVTEHDALIDTGLNEGDPTRFGLLAKEDAVTTDLLETGFGLVCIQRVKHFTLANSATSATTPAYDTSIPQISEGTQIFTKDFTPLSDSSTIVIRVRITGDAANSDRTVTIAVFKDTTANAIAADSFYIAPSGASNGVQGSLEYEEPNSNTTLRTYSVRLGVSAATTYTVNGSTGTLGGVRKSFLLIEEWVTI